MPCCYRLSALLLTIATPLEAQAPSSQLPRSASPSVHEWMSLRAPDGPQISPDGSRVAYLHVTPDWDGDRFDTEIWLATLATGEQRQLTSSKASSSSPAWSPDGKRLTFMSARAGTSQVFMISPPDTTAVQLTHAANGVDDYRWSPDGTRIAYTSSIAVYQPNEPREFHVVGNEARWSVALWLQHVGPNGSTSAPTRVTDPSAFVVDDISWSPDSKRVAFHGSEVGAKYPFWTYDIYVADMTTGVARKIVDTPGPQFFPVWSPDGREIVYRTYIRSPGEEYYTYSMGYLAAVPAEGGVPRVLTSHFDEQATPLLWTKDGIYFVARARTFQHLYRLKVNSGAIDRMSNPLESVNFAFSFTRDRRTVAFASMDAKQYQDIYVASITNMTQPKRITRFGDQLDRWAIASREIVAWRAKDGTPIEGILMKPAGFDSTKTYPLVVIVHGGPLAVDQATITRDLMYPAELFTGKGAVVLRPNYRGSIGYGALFRSMLARTSVIAEYEDIVSGVDMLAQRGYIDRNRVGLMGWSHGGIIASIAATYGQGFRAISAGATVSDLRIFHTYGAGAGVKAEISLWDAPDYYRSQSALSYVNHASTPTLIQHGEADRTAPIVGAYELRRALEDRGVPVKMIVYPGSGHLPSSLKQTRTMVEQNLEWFGHWLWNEPTR